MTVQQRTSLAISCLSGLISLKMFFILLVDLYQSILHTGTGVVQDGAEYITHNMIYFMDRLKSG